MPEQYIPSSQEAFIRDAALAAGADPDKAVQARREGSIIAEALIKAGAEPERAAEQLIAAGRDPGEVANEIQQASEPRDEREPTPDDMVQRSKQIANLVGLREAVAADPDPRRHAEIPEIERRIARLQGLPTPEEIRGRRVKAEVEQVTKDDEPTTPATALPATPLSSPPLPQAVKDKMANEATELKALGRMLLWDYTWLDGPYVYIRYLILAVFSAGMVMQFIRLARGN